MNFNASRNVNAGGPRKAKRVVDVAAMGAPSPAPSFSPAAPYNPGYAQGPPPPYQQGIQLDGAQNFGTPEPAGNFGYMAGYPQTPMASPANIGAMLHQPIVQDMAMQYGNQLAAQGREVVTRELGKFVPVSRLRYYFAVDTNYVLKKLLLILFPYRHQEWMVKYDQESPVQPRYDVNAPDLYIPCMGYVSYVLLAGFMLGLQQRFSPEQISVQASGALAYIVCEMALYLATLYVTATRTALNTLDLLAFSGYKYTAMIYSLLAALALGAPGYYACLLYCSLGLSYFLVKTLRLRLLTGPTQTSEQPSYAYAAHYASPNPYTDSWAKPSSGGTKRRVYFLLFVAITQPLLSWWLTYHLVPSSPALPPVTSAG
ncbi:protein YIF1B-B [Pararge aegeria]|uniref:Protein YIF1 n=2 Tax=Pararge aegeria TaxID=116150 RepID=A0A8S4RMW2_9NEOP|nr:protein YIF1B-B [Pararge aegeria]CAH2238128.1 jg22056 [Pararge aegeria aegeria]